MPESCQIPDPDPVIDALISDLRARLQLAIAIIAMYERDLRGIADQNTHQIENTLRYGAGLKSGLL